MNIVAAVWPDVSLSGLAKAVAAWAVALVPRKGKADDAAEVGVGWGWHVRGVGGCGRGVHEGTASGAGQRGGALEGLSLALYIEVIMCYHPDSKKRQRCRCVAEAPATSTWYLDHRGLKQPPLLCAVPLVHLQDVRPLFDRIGGTAAVELTVETFYRRMLSDPVLRDYFSGVDMTHLKRKQVRD